MPQKKNSKRKTTNTYPTHWMDADVAKTAKQLDTTERLELAEELERKATQLRGFSDKPLKGTELVSFIIRPKQKEALEFFARQHGEETGDVSIGARWVMEVALTMLQKVSDRAKCLDRYLRAEGLEATHLMEAETAKAIAQCKVAFDRVDDDDHGDDWKA